MDFRNLLASFCRLLTLALPCTISGLTLIIFLKKKWWRNLYCPLDLNKKIGGVRIFGDNKTFLGVVIHLTVCILVCLLLNVALNSENYIAIELIHPLFYHPPILLGLIYGAGYVLGELINSFVKRRLEIDPGGKSESRLQHFFDLNDGPLVIVSTLCFLQWLSLTDGFWLFLLGWLIHSATDILMKKIKLKQS